VTKVLLGVELVGPILSSKPDDVHTKYELMSQRSCGYNPRESSGAAFAVSSLTSVVSSFFCLWPPWAFTHYHADHVLSVLMAVLMMMMVSLLTVHKRFKESCERIQ
jgi:lipopolysaccharide export LptBFGC system permease protein LptF